MLLYSSDIITVVLSVLLITIGCGVAGGACVALFRSRPYPRIYSAILFIALFLITIGCLATVESTIIYGFNGTIQIVESYFVAFFPALTWWLNYDIMSIASYPRVQYELKQKQREQEALSIATLSPSANINNNDNDFCVTCTQSSWQRLAWYSYGFIIIILFSFLVSISTSNAFSGPTFINFSNVVYLLIYWIWIRHPLRSKDVRPLSCPSYKLFTGLLCCTTVGSIFMGITSVILSSTSRAEQFFEILYYISKFILNELTGALILVLVLLAFPRSWEQPIRATEGQYGNDNDEEEREDSYCQHQHPLQQLTGMNPSSSSYPLVSTISSTCFFFELL